MSTIRTYDNSTLVAAQTIATTYDWAATPPTVTITVTDDATGQVVSTDTRPATDREIAHQQIVATWGQRRAALLAASGALDTAAPQIVSANQQVQAATTATQMLPAIKAYASANLTALGALKDAQGAVLGALGIVEQAMAWLDAELADMQDEG